jgi:hypothetical protein
MSGTMLEDIKIFLLNTGSHRFLQTTSGGREHHNPDFAYRESEAPA